MYNSSSEEHLKNLKNSKGSYLTWNYLLLSKYLNSISCPSTFISYYELITFPKGQHNHEDLGDLLGQHQLGQSNRSTGGLSH
jgi:hypothetical protein